MYRKGNGQKYAEFGYPVTKLISSAARGSRDKYVESRRQSNDHTSTGHITDKTHMFTGYAPDNKRLINVHHCTSTRLLTG